jgi:glycosyltransferase involved in cell wall biosynthesis
VSAHTISAMVRVYNGEGFVGETVAALLAQTRPPDEVVIVDDGSTDGTPAVLAGFGDAIRVVRQPNSGLAAAFNRGFSECRGDYVAICDADDLWEPGKLERQAAVLADHPEIDLMFGAVSIFGTGAGNWGLPDGHPTGLLAGREFASHLFRINVVSTSTVVARRSLHERVGPFEEHLGAEDYDFWMRAALLGATFYWDPEILARYRRHDDQVTHGRLRLQRAGHEVRSLHEGELGDRRLVDSVLAANEFKIARLLVDEGRVAEARDMFRSSARRSQAVSTTIRARLWVAILGLPDELRAWAAQAFVGVSRRLDAARGGRPAMLP